MAEIHASAEKAVGFVTSHFFKSFNQLWCHLAAAPVSSEFVIIDSRRTTLHFVSCHDLFYFLLFLWLVDGVLKDLIAGFDLSHF